MSYPFYGVIRRRGRTGLRTNGASGRYHHLNHYAIFGGGYRDGAMGIMKRLLRKYRNGS